MKILHVVPYFPPAYSYGGPVKRVYEISKLQREKGHEVTVLTTDVLDSKSRSNLPFEKNENGIRIFRVKNFSNFLASKFNFYYSSELNKFINLNLDFDVVHYHDFRSLNNYLLVNHFANKKVPQVMSPYGSMAKEGKGLIKTIFDIYFGNFIKRKISLYFAVNSFEKKLIEKATKQQCVILPNTINLDEIKKKPFDPIKELKLPKDKKIILFFARLHSLKNPDFAIQVFNKLSEKIKSESILVLVGPDNGAYKSSLTLVESLNLKGKVFVINKFIGNERWDLYEKSHVLIAPTKDQAFPLAMLEALSQNTPIVTSEIVLKNAPKELASVVEFNELKYAGVIEKYLANKKPANGYNYVKENFSTKEIINTLDNYYKSVR